MKRYILLLILGLLYSCNFNANATYENENVEKDNAETVIGLLYYHTINNNVNEVINLFGNSFFKTSSKEKLKEFLIEKKRALGDFKYYSLINWKTNRVTGTNPKTEYLMVYKVKYSNYNATETISLIKENEKIKIVGYNVDKE